MELAQTLRLYDGDHREYLKFSLLECAVEGVSTDARFVCCDGAVTVHKPYLLIFIPEICLWLPEITHNEDFCIILQSVRKDTVLAAVNKIYLENDPSLLLSTLGLQQQTQRIHITKVDIEDEIVEKAAVVEDQLIVENEDDDFVADVVDPDKSELGEKLKYQKLFPCPGCDKAFTTTHYLKTHEVRHHDSSLLVSVHTCLGHPGWTFQNINRLQAHFNELHSQKLIREMVTKGKVRPRKKKVKGSSVDLSKEAMELLTEAVLKPKVFGCSFCNTFSTDREESLKNHIDLCHVPVLCPECNKQISSRRNLKSHQMYVHKIGGLANVCTVCGKYFATVQGLKKHHESRHVADKKFKCSLCPKSYGTRSMLKEHTESRHMDAQYPCTTCGKAFGTRALLRGHELTHSAFRKFSCDECNKRFRTREKLRNHQSCHSNQKYACHVCGSQFSRTETLRVHMKIHDESKAIKCQECGKLFDTTQKHKEHMNTHTGEKPFICSACGSAFSSSSSLCHHRRNCAYAGKLQLQQQQLEPQQTIIIHQQPQQCLT